MSLTKDIETIIDTLNSVCGTKYRPTTKATQRHIAARLNEGFTLDDFRRVICFKNDQWGSDPKMMEYLRPETLFGTKFESYLNAALKVPNPNSIAFNFPNGKRVKPEVAL